MKKLLALILLAFMGFSYHSKSQTNFCSASETATFNFAVEQPIGLTAMTSTAIDLGGICPGCTKTFTSNINGTNCIAWDVTGGADCIFEAEFSRLSLNLPHISFDYVWQYHDDGPTVWEDIKNSSHKDNTWYISGAASGGTQAGENVGFRCCITELEASCHAQANVLSIDAIVSVNYVCSIKQ